MIRLMLDDQYPTMPWDKIDAVVFDVGNVLLSWTAEEILNRVLPECPELHDELTVRVFKSPYWCMRDRGTITLEEAVQGMSAGAPQLAPHVRRILEKWIDIPEIPEGVETLKACKAHGKKVIALTNYADNEFAHACRTHPLFDLFDGFIVSSRLQLLKPGLEIYAHVLHQFSLDPGRTLFIDDSPANIEAALESGWQGLCYNKAGKLTAFFAK